MSDALAEEASRTVELADMVLNDLSDELLLQIFTRIGHPPKLASCSRLSRRFLGVLTEDGLWKDILVQATTGKQPPRNGVPLVLSGPGESYRNAYIRLMYDVSRLEITSVELVNSTWHFYFQSDMYLFHASPEQAAQRAGATGNQGHVATFSHTGFFSSNIAGAPSRRTPPRWHLLARSAGEPQSPMAAAGADEAGAPPRGDGRLADSDERRREVCASAAERRSWTEPGEEGREAWGGAGHDMDAPPSPSQLLGPISPGTPNPMQSPWLSEIVLPHRSPSGDWPLLASAASGSYVQVRVSSRLNPKP
jgi:hypothetical protein